MQSSVVCGQNNVKLAGNGEEWTQNQWFELTRCKNMHFVIINCTTSVLRPRKFFRHHHLEDGDQRVFGEGARIVNALAVSVGTRIVEGGFFHHVGRDLEQRCDGVGGKSDQVRG